MDEQLAQERNVLRDSMFQIEDGRLKFNSALDIDEEHILPIHSAEAQLYVMSLKWGDIIPRSADIAASEVRPEILDAQEYPEIFGDLVLTPEMKGGPADVFKLLNTAKRFGLGALISEQSPAEYLENLQEVVSDAEFVDLLGAISVPSIREVTQWLETQNFAGTLRVHDISVVPLRLGAVYKSMGLLTSAFDMTFHETNMLDPVNLVGAEQTSSLAISDVLGYYTDLAEFESLADYTEILLRERHSYYLSRELVEPRGVVPSDKRQVGGFDASCMHSVLEDLYPGQDFTWDIIDEGLKTRFGASRTTQRYYPLEYMAPISSSSLSLGYTINQIAKPHDSRFFTINIFSRSGV